MISLPLSIRYREQPQHEPVAWLVPGNEAQLWLEEWLRWNLPQPDWRVAVIPGWGALTILPAGLQPAVIARAMAFGRVGKRLYLPLHAELIPALTPEELEELLPRETVAAVFHPARGLLMFTAESLVTIDRLFEQPQYCAMDWTAAQPGEALNDRLLSVQPAAELTIQEIMQAGQGDIGSQGNQIQQLPARPGEPGSGAWDQAGRSVTQSVAQWLSGLAKSMAGPAKPTAAGTAGGVAGGSWLQSLAKWADNRLSGVTKQIEEMRNRELLRLMHMLQNNPDEGLKYALPFNNGGEHRGLAAPGSSLASRDINFNLNWLGGGGRPADVWNMPAHYQVQLIQRYRELANRELQLGRHRRAAYIFGQLLGDLEAAASALRAGEHWREAAILYRDRLKRPLVAAECLERGGLLHEAIALYEPLAEHEKVGDLYARLDQTAEARTAWSRAAAQYEGNGRHLHSARLLEVKLDRPDESQQVLDRGWRAGAAPRELLEALFGLFVRQGWHDQARARIKSLRDDYTTVNVAIPSSEALVSVSQTYPDRTIGALAADTVRLLAATHLPAAEIPTRTKFVAILQSLVPNDRLLQRDGQRYLRDQESALPASRSLTVPASRSLAKTCPLVREFQLSDKSNWYEIAAQGEHFYAIGNFNYHVDLRLFNWSGQAVAVSRSQRPLPREMVDPPQVAVDLHDHGPLLVSFGGGCQSAPTTLEAGSLLKNVLLYDHGFGRAPNGSTFVGLSYALHRAFFLVREEISGEVVAKGYQIGAKQQLGDIAISHSVVGDSAGNRPLPTHGRPDLLAVGVNNSLVLIGDEDLTEYFEFSSEILRIAGSAPFSRTRLAVITTEANRFFAAIGKSASLPGFTEAPQHFAQDLHQPLVCFSGGGRLVAIAASGGEIYETTGGKLTLHSRLASLGELPLSLQPTNEPDQFAVLMRNGTVRVYAIG